MSCDKTLSLCAKIHLHPNDLAAQLAQNFSQEEIMDFLLTVDLNMRNLDFKITLINKLIESVGDEEGLNFFVSRQS